MENSCFSLVRAILNTVVKVLAFLKVVDKISTKLT